jgi:hypothetical protein
MKVKGVCMHAPACTSISGGSAAHPANVLHILMTEPFFIYIAINKV